MGLLAKFKGIIFDEEVVDTPKEEKKETKVEEVPISRQIQPEKKPEVVEAPPVVEPASPVATAPKNTYPSEKEKDIFSRDNNSFPFPDFDPEEFDHNVSRPTTPSRVKPNPTNVMEYERKRRLEKRTELSRSEKSENREAAERKKFKPSPIISPVYGILNEDYRIEDIKDKIDKDNLDIDSVRKKAFEPTMQILDEKPIEKNYEDNVTVKTKEPLAERVQKVRTIDELLEDTSDEIIPIKEPKKITERSVNEYDDIDRELEELIKEPAVNTNHKKEFDDDSALENDLFDLIDSMYDSREDGEL